MRFFVLSFPYSNTAVACLTPGENAECTCAALRGLFELLGDVPRRIVFDNAVGMGRKRRDGGVCYTEPFGAFRACSLHVSADHGSGICRTASIVFS